MVQQTINKDAAIICVALVASSITGNLMASASMVEHSFNSTTNDMQIGIEDNGAFLQRGLSLGGQMELDQKGNKQKMKQECHAILYQHHNYATYGWTIVLGVGDHQLGYPYNNDASSIKVQGGEGCTAHLYENGDFSGWEKAFSIGENGNLGGDMNDAASAMRVFQATQQWAGPFNSDISGVGMGGSIATTLEDCKQRCLNNNECEAIQYSSSDTHGDNNCFIFDNTDDNAA